MRIRKINIRSIKVLRKNCLMQYLRMKHTKALYDEINQHEDVYDLYEIPKDLYTLYYLRHEQDVQEDHQLKEA